jgi:hypothetical protein
MERRPVKGVLKRAVKTKENHFGDEWIDGFFI